MVTFRPGKQYRHSIDLTLGHDPESRRWRIPEAHHDIISSGALNYRVGADLYGPSIRSVTYGTLFTGVAGFET